MSRRTVEAEPRYQGPEIYPVLSVPYVATLADRPGQCICTWVVMAVLPGGETVFHIKYVNATCPVYGHNS